MSSMKKSKNKEKYVYPELYNNTCMHKNQKNINFCYKLKRIDKMI